MLSVIVPCYNRERYIERCLNSIINQTYKNLEIIVVDDGSTDGTKDIISSISDKRIKYIYQKNSGVSNARNMGIDNANGELITFVDSDDNIDNCMYETLIGLMEKHNVDIVHCSYKKIINDKVKEIGNSGKIYEFNTEEAVEHFVKGDLFVGSNCNKIYCSELFDNLRFNNSIKINEDVLINFYLFSRSKKSVFIDRCYYNYHENFCSSSHKTYQEKVAEDVYYVNKLIYDECKGKSYESAGVRRYACALSGIYRVYLFSKEKTNRDLSKKYKREIIKLYDEGLLEGNNKTNAFLIKYFEFIYKPMYKIYNKIRKPNWDI